MTGFCGGFDESKDLESGIWKWGSVRVCPFLAHQESWILVQVNGKLLTHKVGSKLTRRPFQESFQDFGGPQWQSVLDLPDCGSEAPSGAGFACLFLHTFFRPCTVLQETMQPGFQCSSVLQKIEERSADLHCLCFKTLRQNNAVLRRAALSGPKPAPNRAPKPGI
jgi:hypothetical protein